MHVPHTVAVDFFFQVHFGWQKVMSTQRGKIQGMVDLCSTVITRSGNPRGAFGLSREDLQGE